MGFEPTIQLFERLKTVHALDFAVIGTHHRHESRKTPTTCQSESR